MLIQDLAQKLLLPPSSSSRTIRIVSGYASPSAVLWCLTGGDMDSTSEDAVAARSPRVELLIGMTPSGCVTQGEHEAFRDLCARYRGKLSIRYVSGNQSVHSKVYAWYAEDGTPVQAFSGSANFTNPGLNIGGDEQENVMSAVDPETAAMYIESRMQDSFDCLDPTVGDHISFASGRVPEPASDALPTAPLAIGQTGDEPVADAAGASVNFYLYSRKYRQAFNPGGGVNWGARPERKNQDESYLPIPVHVSRSGFLPPRNTPITVHCDDGRVLILRGSSGNQTSHPSGKDLGSLPSNGILGAYLRWRMEVPSGTPIGIPEILSYGRSFVTLTRLDDESYFLDFSRPPAGQDMAFGDLDLP